MSDDDSTSVTAPELAPAHAARALRRATLAAFAAELGHELQGPMNLFRLTKERLARGEQLDQDDVSMLDEELERLSRLSGRLRELAHGSLLKVVCSPREIVDAALGYAPTPASLGLELQLDVSPPLQLSCDLPLLARAVRELIDNALEARATRAGVRFRTGEGGGLCVWDDGPGFELDAARAMSWGVSTRPLAAGLGLTLALRAARAHGFSLELRREPPLTEAWLLIPGQALRSGPTTVSG
jgi:signal transduction histidine kinase